MNMDFSVYLAGPMTGLTFEQMIGWRKTATKRLRKAGWTVLSPIVGQLTGKNAQPKGTINMDSARSGPGQEERRPIGRVSSAFVTQDRLYVKKVDVVLAHLLDAPNVSIGTVWEMAWADALDKQLVTVVTPGSVHDHAFVRRRSNVFVPTLEEALEYLEGLVAF
jgi:nucleoside 2-deoxyribosyltransferase